MRLKHIPIFAALAIMFAAILWAVDGILLTPWITDLGLWDVPTFVFMLHAVATLFLSYFLITKKEELKRLNRKDWIAFGLTGLFGGAIGTMAIIAAIINVYNNDLNISSLYDLPRYHLPRTYYPSFLPCWNYFYNIYKQLDSVNYI